MPGTLRRARGNSSRGRTRLSARCTRCEHAHHTLPRPSEAKPVRQTCIVSPRLRHCPQVIVQGLEQVAAQIARLPSWVDSIMHPSPISAGLHYPGCPEPPQVPRDLVLRHLQRIDQLTDTELLSPQESEQPEARRVAQGFQEPAYIFIGTRPWIYVRTRIYLSCRPSAVNMVPPGTSDSSVK
jgi:hypothetical protein